MVEEILVLKLNVFWIRRCVDFQTPYASLIISIKLESYICASLFASFDLFKTDIPKFEVLKY